MTKSEIPHALSVCGNKTCLPFSCLISQYLPENGIRIFASFPHTHLLGKGCAVGMALLIHLNGSFFFCTGHGITVQHFTTNEECGATEELKPIYQNLKYDFDYQVTTSCVLCVRACVCVCVCARAYSAC